MKITKVDDNKIAQTPKVGPTEIENDEVDGKEKDIWETIKNVAVVIGILAAFVGIYKNCSDIKSINAKLPKAKLFLANYETGGDESNYHDGAYKLKPNEVAENAESKVLSLHLATIHDIKKGADLPVENIRVWLRCDGCTINTSGLNVDGLGEKKEITENGNQTWTVLHVAKHSPPAPLRLRGLKINAPKNMSEITLFYRIEADFTETVDSKLVLKMP